MMRFHNRAGTGGGARSLVAALAFLLVGALAPAAGGFPDDLVISDARYSIEAADRVAVVTLALELLATADGWQAAPLIPSSVALRSFEVDGKRAYIEAAGERYVAHVHGEGRYRVKLSFALDADVRGEERSIILPLVRSTSGRVRFTVDKSNYAVKSSPEMPVEISKETARTVATLFPTGLDAVAIHWLPEALERERATVFEAREESFISLRRGLAARDTRLTVGLRRGHLDSVTIAVPTGTDVVRLNACGDSEGLVERWRVEGEGAERRLCVRLKSSITDGLTLSLKSEQVIPGAKDIVNISPFAVQGAARQTGWMGLSVEETLSVVEAGSIGLRRAARRPAAFDFRSSGLAFEYASLPAELKLKLSSILPRITATTASHVRLQAGIVELLAKIAYRVENAPVQRLRIGLDEGLVVLDVSGEGLETWSASDERVEVRLKHPIRGDYTLALKCLQNLRRMNGVLIPHVRCLDAERESGTVGISAGEDITLLHFHSRKFVQVAVGKLPAWVRALDPKLAYIYDQPGGVLAVSTSHIEPVVHVEGYAVANVAEDAVQEEYVFTCDIKRRPVFRFILRLPAGLTPINLLGDAVADWEFHPEQCAATVSLRKGRMGRVRLQLFCERRREPDAENVPLGGVALLGADDFSGWFGLGTGANLELVPERVQAMTPVDIKDTPPLVSSFADLKLAYRWSGERWGMLCAARAIAPRIEAETRTALFFGAGHMRTRTDIIWKIAKAGLDELLIALPERAVNSQLTGENIRGRELTDNLWRIRLAEPVKGECRLSITFDQLPDAATGTMRYTGLKLPQAERQTGVVAAYLEDPQIEVLVGEMSNAARSDSAPGVDGGGHPFLDAFTYSDPNRSVAFTLKGHAMARGVLLNAEACSISTVVKRQGQAVSYMSCRVRNAGTQFFRMKLPEDAMLWGTYVQGKPVRPNKVPKGEILIPVSEAPRNVSFDLGVIWSEPVKRLGFGTSLALTSPELGLPAERVNWDVFLPRDYQLVSAGGNMTLEKRPAWYRQGLPGIARGYLLKAWPVLKVAFRVIAWVAGIGIVAALLAFVIRSISKLIRKLRAGEVRRPAFSTVAVVLAVLLLVVVAALFIPSLSRAREEARREICAELPAQELLGDISASVPARPSRAAAEAGRDIGVRRPGEKAPAVPEALAPPASAEMAQRMAGEKKALAKGKEDLARRGRHDRAVQLGQSLRKRGEYREAEEQFRVALKNVPKSSAAQKELDRLKHLKAEKAPSEDERVELDVAGAKLRIEEPLAAERYGVGSLMTLSENLKKELGKDWYADIAESDKERDLLDLVTGRKEQLAQRGGGAVQIEAGDMVLKGLREDNKEMMETAGLLSGRMVRKIQAINREKQRRAAEVAARRRAAMRRIEIAQETRPRRSGGTISGSRGAGAMPLGLSFPSFGTKAYPFHMDYAGDSQARIEMALLRTGTAIVLQGTVTIAVLLLACILSWYRMKIGVPLAVLAALILAFTLRVGGEASKQYVVMALLGLCLAAPVILARLVLFARGRGDRA